jgi:hypothetical protein
VYAGVNICPSTHLSSASSPAASASSASALPA